MVRSSRPGWVLAVASMTLLLDALDLSITQVALPDIGHDLGVSADALPWVANAYVLTYGGLLLLGGRLCDLVGHRIAFFAGLVVFGGGSLVAGLSQDVTVLISARALQGIGAAFTVPAAVALIAATFPQGPPRQRALGVFAACGSAGFSVGLILGGALTGTFGWPSIFLVKVPVVTLIAAVALAVIPRATRSPGRSYDVPGAITGAAGPLLLAFAITSVAAPNPDPVVLGGAAVLGVVVLFGFWRREWSATDPLVPLTLFANRTARVADLVSFTVLAAPFGFAFVAVAYLQNIAHYSALQTGLAVLPGGVLSAIVSRYGAPWLIGRWGLRWTGVTGLALVALGFGWLAAISAAPSYVAVVLPASLVGLGLGMGLAYPTFTVAAVTDVDESRQGVAAGVQNAALQLGGGLGFAIVAAVVGSIAQGRPAGDLVSSLREGALAGCALPLLGAVGALVMPARSRQPAHETDAPAAT